MAKSKSKKSASKSRGVRKAKPESWPNLQFGSDSNGKKIPVIARVGIAVLVLAAIAGAVGMWHCSRTCYKTPANPEGQPQARQVIPQPVIQHQEPQQPPSVSRVPVRPNAAAPKAGAKARLDRIVFRTAKKEPMVLMPRRSATVGVEARILDSQNKVLKTLEKPAGKPGRVRLDWDGKDSQGAPVPNGMYIVKIKSAEGEDTKELKVVK